MFKKVPVISCLILVTGILLTGVTQAAKVTCDFMFGTIITSSGEWVQSIGFESLYDVFSEPLELKLENSLLDQLDTQQPFFVGTTKQGNVYIAGGDGGVDARAIKVEGDKIKIYGGMCEVGFGN